MMVAGSMRRNLFVYLLFLILFLIFSGKASGVGKLSNDCIIHKRSDDINATTVGSVSRSHLLAETIFVCSAASHQIFITYDMLIEPIALITDLSTLCDYDKDIRSIYSLNNEISSCYSGLVLQLLNQIKHVSKQVTWIGTSRVADAILILHTIQRHYIASDIIKTNGLTLKDSNGLFLWRPKVAIFVIVTEVRVFESCPPSLGPNVTGSCKQSSSSKNNGDVKNIISNMRRHLLHNWGDKSIWVDLTLYIGYPRGHPPESNSGTVTNDRYSHQIDCDEELKESLDSLSDVLSASKCFEIPDSGYDENASMMQNYLINQAYKEGAEYFIFPDWSVPVIFHEGWLLRSITALEKSQLAPNMGVVIQGGGCSEGFNEMGRENEVVYIAFHRTHVSLLRSLIEGIEKGIEEGTRHQDGIEENGGILPSHLLAVDPILSPRMNALAVIEAYMYYGAVFCPTPPFYDVVVPEDDSAAESFTAQSGEPSGLKADKFILEGSFIDQSVDSQTFPQMTLEGLNLYGTRVEDLRVSIAALVRSEYPLLGVQWTTEMVSYRSGDLFHELYCSFKPAVVESSVQDPDYDPDRNTNPSPYQLRNPYPNPNLNANPYPNPNSRSIADLSSFSNEDEIASDIPFEAMFTSSHTAKIAFITAIYGNYEKSVKRFTRQRIPTDFICFTDNSSLHSNGWILDSIPYHDLISHQGNDLSSTHRNSLHNNRHPFNIAKFYKTSFRHIPRLQRYDIIIWLDGTIEITDPGVSEYIMGLIIRESGENENFIVFEHDRKGCLKVEAELSMSNGRYNTTQLNGISQPVQDVDKQYNQYITDGYLERIERNPVNLNHKSLFALESGSSSYWKKHLNRIEYGVFVTCFLAMDMRNAVTPRILDLWYQQILEYTTQDQVSFPYVTQMNGVHPYPLPDDTVRGDSYMNTMFLKHEHGI